MVVIAHHLFASTKCTLWPVLIEEISRVLAPGGLMIVSVLDVHAQQSGPLLDSWTHQHMTMNILRRFMVHQPSLLLPSWVEEDGRFLQEHVERIGFPCMPGFGQQESQGETSRPGSRRRKSYSSQLPTARLDQIVESMWETSHGQFNAPPTGSKDQLLASSLAGWNFYEALYADFLSAPDHRVRLDRDSQLPWTRPMSGWCMDHEDVWRECQKTRPFFEMTTFVYRRREHNQESVLAHRIGMQTG